MSLELGRLLIVDDDRAFAEKLRTDGLRMGLSVDTVYDSVLFAKKLIDWEPPIIAIDLVMPGSDGLELLQAHASLPGCRSRSGRNNLPTY